MNYIELFVHSFSLIVVISLLNDLDPMSIWNFTLVLCDENVLWKYISCFSFERSLDANLPFLCDLIYVDNVQ